MKIVLCTSPHLKHSAVLEADFKPRRDLMYTFAPLGLLSLCAAVRERNKITPILYDLNDRINREIITNSDFFYASAAEDILSFDPDVVGFMTECDSFHHVMQFCAAIKSRKPSCYIVLGGPHATAVAEEAMTEWDAIDCIVMGEGEISFPELIDQLLNHRDEVIAGTVMRDRSRDPRKGAHRALMDSLDDLPFPAYDLYQPLQGEEIYLEAGRGCPFQCTFCSTSPFWQRKHRVKSPARIVAEVQYVLRLFPVERIHFTHDLFTANPAWVREVCQALIGSGVNIRWTCSSRVDTIDKDLVGLMAKAGCNAIFFGVESGSPDVLNQIMKKISYDQTLQAIQWCHEHRITPNVGLIIGFPFETGESFKSTFSTFVQLLVKGAKPVHLFSYCPFVQSSIYPSLKNLECTGHFMDIPLPKLTAAKNRELIRNNYALFSSYFKPELSKEISSLGKGMLYAIDEFALLVDCTRFASIIISEIIGGMDKLFFSWAEYIRRYNMERGKNKEREYYGAPVDYCGFLLHLLEGREISETYLPELIAVFRKNFEIASGLKAIEPTTMAGYKSRVLPAGLYGIQMRSRVSIDSVIDTKEVHHDFSALLDNEMPGRDVIVARKRMYLVWQRGSANNVSLISVSASIHHLIQQVKRGQLTIEELLDNWMQFPADSGIQGFFDKMQEAMSKNLITLNE